MFTRLNFLKISDFIRLCQYILSHETFENLGKIVICTQCLLVHSKELLLFTFSLNLTHSFETRLYFRSRALLTHY